MSIEFSELVGNLPNQTGELLYNKNDVICQVNHFMEKE